MIRGRRALGCVDEGAVRARDQDVRRALAFQRAANRVELPNGFALPRKISARMNALERKRSLAREHHRPRAFAQDHAPGPPRERLDRRRRAQQRHLR